MVQQDWWVGGPVPVAPVDTGELSDGAVTTAKLDDDAVTTAKIEDDAVTAAKIAPAVGIELFASVVLTSAQVKALKAAPITLVAAPGSGVAVVPTAVNVIVEYGGTNAFTEDGDDLSIGYDGGAELKEIESTGLVGETNDEQRYITFEYPETFIPEADTAVEITNLDDEIAGNAAGDNTIKVDLYYRLISVPAA